MQNRKSSKSITFVYQRPKKFLENLHNYKIIFIFPVAQWHVSELLLVREKEMRIFFETLFCFNTTL